MCAHACFAPHTLECGVRRSLLHAQVALSRLKSSLKGVFDCGDRRGYRRSAGVSMTAPLVRAFCVAAVCASWQARAVDIGKIMHESRLLGRGPFNTIFVAARNGPKPIERGRELQKAGLSRRLNREQPPEDQTWMIKSQGRFHTYMETELHFLKQEIAALRLGSWVLHAFLTTASHSAHPFFSRLLPD